MQVYAEQQRAVVASLPSVADGEFFETQPVGEADVDLEAMDADEGGNLWNHMTPHGSCVSGHAWLQLACSLQATLKIITLNVSYPCEDSQSDWCVVCACGVWCGQSAGSHRVHCIPGDELML